MSSIIEQFLKEQFQFEEKDGKLVTAEPLSLEKLSTAMKILVDATVDVCANKAMVEEEFGDDWELQGYSEKSIIHSGGYIKEEHFTKVNQDSIVAVKEIIK